MRPKRRLNAFAAIAVAAATLISASPAYAAEPIEFPPGYEGQPDTLCQHDATTNTVACEPLQYSLWDKDFTAPTPGTSYPSTQSVDANWGEQRLESPATVVPINTVVGGSDFAVQPSATPSLSRNYTLDASFFDNSSAAPVDAVKVVDFFGTVISPAEWDAQSTTPWENPYAGKPGELVQTTPTGRAFPVTAIDGNASEFTGALLSKTLEFNLPTPTMMLISENGIHAVAYMVKLTAVTETTYKGVTTTSSVSGLFSTTSDARSNINSLGEENCETVPDAGLCAETSGLNFAWQSVSLAADLENVDPVDPPVVIPVDPPVTPENGTWLQNSCVISSASVEGDTLRATVSFAAVGDYVVPPVATTWRGEAVDELFIGTELQAANPSGTPFNSYTTYNVVVAAGLSEVTQPTDVVSLGERSITVRDDATSTTGKSITLAATPVEIAVPLKGGSTSSGTVTFQVGDEVVSCAYEAPATPVQPPTTPPVDVDPPTTPPVTVEPPMELPPTADVPIEEAPPISTPVADEPSAPRPEALAYTGSEAVSGVLLAALALLLTGTGLALAAAKRRSRNA